MRTLITTKGAFRDPNSKTVLTHLAKCHEEGFWLDIEHPETEDIHILEKCFKFHPLTIEDVKHGRQRPKLEEYPGYQFMVLYTAGWAGADVETEEFHLYIARDYLVTIHEHASPVLERLRGRIEATPEIARGKPQFLTYLVVDGVVDTTFEGLEKLDAAIDELEDDIVERAQADDLRRIYTLKHSVTGLRQLLGAQRDLFQRLITESLEDRELVTYYRDVYDHIIRQYETVDSLRDLLTGAMDVYLSTVSQRLNVTMKQLTVVASLFLPLSFLTGFYGMNFAYLTTVLEVPRWTFWIGVATMIGAALAQLYLFKRRGWL
jgi:magnesium transporter